MLAISFGQSWVLSLLVAPVLLLAWTWTREARRLVLPFDRGSNPRGTVLRATLQSAESMTSLTLAVAVFILAGPQRLDTPKLKRAMTNIEFCVDISGSMTAEFGDGTRYDAAMKAINGFFAHGLHGNITEVCGKMDEGATLSGWDDVGFFGLKQEVIE